MKSRTAWIASLSNQGYDDDDYDIIMSTCFDILECNSILGGSHVYPIRSGAMRFINIPCQIISNYYQYQHHHTSPSFQLMKMTQRTRTLHEIYNMEEREREREREENENFVMMNNGAICDDLP